MEMFSKYLVSSRFGKKVITFLNFQRQLLIYWKQLEELERYVKEEIRLREKAEKRLKFLMKKLEFIKESRSSEGSEQLSSSEVSCISSVCTSASKEEEEEELTHENGVVEEVKTDHATENVDTSSKLRDASSGEASVVAAVTSSQEEESQSGHEFSWCSDAT